MSLWSRPRRPPPPVADEEVVTPPPVEDLPPAGRYCDLVLTGGVASGVVYPWALLELARHFHFKNIGGTSVGALAAALAAAAEYGRRNGYRRAFEPLRRTPEQLAEELPGGQRRLLSLFQAQPEGARLLRLFAEAFDHPADKDGATVNRRRKWLRCLLKAYRQELAIGASAGAGIAVLGVFLGMWMVVHSFSSPCWKFHSCEVGSAGLFLIFAALGAVVGAAISLFGTLSKEIRHGLIENHYGLCRGASSAKGECVERPGLTDWLHEGIQRSAGLKLDDPPLTFYDLWHAPLEPGSADRGNKTRPSINLQMMTTNVNHMRPYRLPFADTMVGQLYFRRCEFEGLFPDVVLDALCRAAEAMRPHKLPNSDHVDLLPLPTDRMPIVVAARMSLSFPLLFSAVPVHAPDFEMKPDVIRTERCWFIDGGLCSNFPIHFFDSALPRWPTFGIWLRQRSPHHPNEDVWLPDRWDHAKNDIWHRFEAEAVVQGKQAQPSPDRQIVQNPWKRLGGFLVGGGLAAKDWSDMLAMRVPQNRHRIAQVCLLNGEGELNIAMPRKRILDMAKRYGTRSGHLLVERYVGDGVRATADWKQQRWVRLLVLMKATRKNLRGLTASADGAQNSPLVEALIQEAGEGDLRIRPPKGHKLDPVDSEALRQFVQALKNVEAIDDLDDRPPFDLSPEAEIRLAPPM